MGGKTSSLIGSRGSFKHKPLPSAEHIRIINLQPGSGNDKIRIKVTIEDRKEAANTYDAISYVWGDPTITRPITCNNNTLLITVSLADALCAVRNPTSPRRVWADAICINQRDDEEKGHQIKLMGNIYENAKSVVAWVGLDKDGIAEDCFDRIRKTNEYLDRQLEQYGLPDVVAQLPLLQIPYPICSEPKSWEKVRRLVQLPWFSRAWVVQEVGLAKRASILWGEQPLDIAELMELGYWLRILSKLQIFTDLHELEAIVDTFHCIQAAYTNEETWRSSMPLTAQFINRQQKFPLNFSTIMEVSRTKFTTDPRDRIYAFLGHPAARNRNGEPILEPQYHASVDTVYLDLACRLLDHPREGPYVLSHVKHNSKEQLESRARPSWVPRWDRNSWHSSNQSRVASNRHWFKAGHSNERFKPEINHSENLKFLSVQGFLFDRLTWVSAPINGWNLNLDRNDWDEAAHLSNEPPIDTLRRHTFEAVSWTTEQHEEREDAFSLTLVRGYAWMDKSPDQEAIAEHRLDYAAYLKASRSAIASFRPRPDTHSDQDGDASVVENELSQIDKRGFACTRDGRFALVPRCAEVSDICCVFLGVSVPFVLRPAGEGLYYLIGDAYVHGVMNGELVDELRAGKRQEEKIVMI